jgi:hypothetical protein
VNPSEGREKDFGVPRWAVGDIPIDVEHSRYTFQGKVAVALYADAVALSGPAPVSASHSSQARERIEVAIGQMQIVESSS